MVFMSRLNRGQRYFANGVGTPEGVPLNYTNVMNCLIALYIYVCCKAYQVVRLYVFPSRHVSRLKWCRSLEFLMY